MVTGAAAVRRFPALSVIPSPVSGVISYLFAGFRRLLLSLRRFPAFIVPSPVSGVISYPFAGFRRYRSLLPRSAPLPACCTLCAAVFVAGQSGIVQADHQLGYRSAGQPVCLSGGEYYCDSSSTSGTCAAAMSRHQQLYGASIWAYEGVTVTSDTSCYIGYCPNEPAEGGCNEDTYQYTTKTISVSTYVKEHDDNDPQCEVLLGEAVAGSYYQETPESDICMNSCEVDIEYQLGAGSGSDSQWWYAGLYSGAECAVGAGPEIYKAKVDEDTNILRDGDAGTSTLYDAPDDPPADADTDVAGVQPPIVEETAQASTGETVTAYTMEGGGTIFVVEDSAGNITFTDLSPIGGSGSYAPGTTIEGSADSGGSTGSGDDGSGDGGITGGSGDDGSGDGGTDDGGTATAGDGEEDGEDDTTADGGGTCDAAPTCSGDAILCAVLEQQWKLRCEADVPEEATFLAETGLDDYSDVEGTLYEEVDVSDPLGGDMFDTSGFGGSSGGCPADPTITVFGQTMGLPLEHSCWVIDKLSYLVLILATITCVRIVAGTEL